MLDKELLKTTHAQEEYINHAETFNENPEEIESRFKGWYSEHKQDLKQLYKDGVDEDDELICDVPLSEWVRQMFICWDYNLIKQNQIQSDIDWELQFQAELQAMGI
jgi:hypothetical protein